MAADPQPPAPVQGMPRDPPPPSPPRPCCGVPLPASGRGARRRGACRAGGLPRRAGAPGVVWVAPKPTFSLPAPLAQGLLIPRPGEENLRGAGWGHAAPGGVWHQGTFGCGGTSGREAGVRGSLPRGGTRVAEPGEQARTGSLPAPPPRPVGCGRRGPQCYHRSER